MSISLTIYLSIRRCMRRSICELGLNGGYWGNLSAMLTQTAGGVLTRFCLLFLCHSKNLLVITIEKIVFIHGYNYEVYIIIVK